MLRQAHKLTSSQAHKLTSSQAHKLTSSQACLLFAIVVSLISFSLGCGSPVGFSADASPDSRLDSRKTPTSFDAGVLFANEASYVCIPLEKLGIDVGEKIASIKSSCECVHPSVVFYLLRKSEEGIAIRLDFVRESNAQAELNPILLGVEIKVQFASGAEQSVTIQFLQTSQQGSAL